MPTDHHARQHAMHDFVFDLVITLAKLFGLLLERVFVAHGVVRLSFLGDGHRRLAIRGGDFIIPRALAPVHRLQ